MKIRLKPWSGPITRGYSFHCPGCNESHQYTTEVDDLKIQTDPEFEVYRSNRFPRWSFDNNLDDPTFTPSLLCTSIRHRTMTDEELKVYDQLVADKGHRAALQDPRFRHVCHLFLTKGRLQFLSDCTHPLAGQTVDLPEIPDRDQDQESDQ